MKKLLLLTTFSLLIFISKAQTGKDFWFAAPDITDLHNIPGGEPLYLLISSTGGAGTVSITQPANPTFNGGVPLTVSLAANASARVNLTPFKNLLETRPTNSVVNTGLHIVSTTNITTYYEISNTNNAEIFALKGSNALGTEFYIPLHKYAPFYNHTFASPHTANASFDIVATQNGTTVSIYSPTPVDGHAALTQFSITLNAGQTYSCGFTGTNYEQPINHPGGAVVLSDKPIAITIKDDSDHNPSGGCYDVVGDQIVPVNVLGTEYIAVKGKLNPTGDESVFITATQNNTNVYVNGSGVPVATLFAGENYRYDMDYLNVGTDNSVYITTSKPAYATHYTGFGCELGMALLPQLGCAGSRQVSFVRSNAQSFFITFLVRATALNNFVITGSGTATINPALFVTVPGTGGVWKAASIQYNTTEIPVDSTFRISNTADVFAMGIINGGSTSGCSYGYFSEFSASVSVDAGVDQTICANNVISLTGAIAGGAVSGIWTTNGSGTFSPSTTDLNAVYTPSAADTTVGTIRLILTSTGSCKAVSDTMNIFFTPAPRVDGGIDQNICSRDSVHLSGSVTGGAVTGLWSTTGTGIFTPNAATLNAIYLPSAADEIAGTAKLRLISTSNGTCIAVRDSMNLTIQRAITINAGSDALKCSNNATLNLAGLVSGGTTTGIWSTSGTGTFSPNSNTLNGSYIPSSADTSNGSVLLILTSSNNNYCIAKRDTLVLSFLDAPFVDAGSDQTICANNNSATLSGNARNCTSILWTSNGTGSFTPNASSLNATYTASATDMLNGSVKLFLTSSGPASCNVVRDSLTLLIIATPIINAGTDQTLCVSNLSLQLNGQISGITNTGIWSSNGTGNFIPNPSTLNATYQLSAADSIAGSVKLILTSTNNNSCNAVRDTVNINITPVGIVNAGSNFSYCSNANPAIIGTIAGSVSSAVWSTLGSGNFSSLTNQLAQNYIPSSADTTQGYVYLILTGNSCETPKDTLRINFTSAPIVLAGSNQFICGRDTVHLSGSVTGGSSTGIWFGNGSGIFLPNAAILNGKYYPSAQDVQNGQVKLYLTSTANGTCNPTLDSITIYFTPSINLSAGSDQLVCANNFSIGLNGSISGGTTTGQWTTSGNGFFAPNANQINATYIATANDTASGFVYLYLTSTNNGNCQAKEDSVRITFTDAPIIIAGMNEQICANNHDIQLNNSNAFNTSAYSWSTNGTGTFTPSNTVLHPVYHASAADILLGQVQLYLSSGTANGCYSVSDSLKLSINPAPIVYAGSDTSICKNDHDIQLNGAVAGITGTGVWSSNGTGNFMPDATTLNAIYNLSTADSINGSISLILISTNNGNCLSVSDTVIIQYIQPGIVNAGNNITICANSVLPLNGLVSGAATAGIWSTTGTGIFTPSTSDLNATYTPGSADTSNGAVQLILTANSCEQPSDTLTVSFTSAPIADAGTDQSVCANNAMFALTGSIQNANGGTWSGGNGVYSPGSNALVTTYTPSANEINNGGVDLILTSTGNGICNSTTSVIHITITPAPVVNAGTDLDLCKLTNSIQLQGSVTGASTSGQWTTSGTGAFNPAGNILNCFYTLSPGDTALNNIDLILTSTAFGNCIAVSDTVSIHLKDPVLINAGADQYLCASQLQASLLGNISGGASAGKWKSSGTGYFIPNDSSLSSTYILSTADSLAGFVQLTLQSNGNGLCPAATDTILLHVQYQHEVNAGADVLKCPVLDPISLIGSIRNATGAKWNASGSGIFSPSDTAMIAYYIPGAQDTVLKTIYISLTTKNDGGCSTKSDTLTLQFDDLLQSEFLSGNGCEDHILNFTDNSTIPGGNLNYWFWNFSDGSTSLQQNPEHTFDQPGNYQVSLFTRSDNGCEGSIVHTINVYPSPIAGFSSNANGFLSGEAINFVNTGTGYISSWWNFGDSAAISASDNPIHTYAAPGTYSVVQILTNQFGCSDSLKDDIVINSDEIQVFPPELPSAFSPNGDNVNDILFVKGGPFKTISFSMYDEWGHLLFNSTKSTEGWDGSKGKPLPIGVYLYTVNAVTTKDESYSIHGEVKLIR
ncbi:hypothetical protein BH11BAC2_BH11BAC2_13430 [soil metagenome]